MKKNPLLASAAVLTAATLLAVGYAICGNPKPPRTPSISSPAPLQARAAPVFSEHPDTAAPSSGASGEAAREPQEAVSGEASGEIRPGAAAIEFQKASTELGEEHPQGNQTGSASRQYQEASNGTSDAGAASPPQPASTLIPLAFIPIPPEVAAANPQLPERAEAIQKNFVDAVGGSNEDPNDPAYYQRWVAAQTEADDEYRLAAGTEGYLLEQIQLNSNTVSAAK